MLRHPVSCAFVRLFALCLLSGSINAAEIKPAGHEFHFVVLGDSQFHDAAGFNRIIDETVRLQPAFVVQVGDMIEGYLGSAKAFDAEWSRFAAQIGPLGRIPFVPVAGNHDVYDASKVPSTMATDIYTRRWGALHHTFTYRNARFIVLNSDEVDAPHAIAGKQLDWLKTVLRRNTSRHVFVFMHRPPALFDNAAALHELFRSHGVRHVIYGHHHHYHFLETDGVRYVMTNAAANSGTDMEATGAFDHLLFASVRDNEVSIAPIKAGAILPADIVAPIDNYDNFELEQNLLPAEVSARSTGERTWQADMALRNTTRRAIDVHLTCTSPDGRWDISPRALPVIRLVSGAEQTLTLTLSRTEDRMPEGTPACTAQVPYQTARGDWLTFIDNTTIVVAPDRDG